MSQLKLQTQTEIKFNTLILASCFILIGQFSSGNQSSVLRVISPVDEPSILDENSNLERNIFILDSSTKKEVDLELKPWANSYWSMEAGILGSRYSDSSFSSKRNWQDRHQYILDNSIQSILSEPKEKKRTKLIDRLSPAEKYDLLVGDTNATLSKAQWAESQRYWQNGSLAHWMGICEGSAAASVFYSEPRQSVELLSPQGIPIEFSVNDVKGLAALLWSSYNVNVPVAGSRCDDSHPEKRNGVVINENCFNNNPGTFHIALLNFLGKRSQVLFMNRALNQEVWNVPIVSYKTTYFNLNRRSRSGELNESVISLASLESDKLREFRAPQTTQIVGVETTLKYGTLSGRVSEVKYSYQLELDSTGVILGGEWLTDNHPDFLWTVQNGFRPLSTGDQALVGQKWEGNKIPANWLEPIRLSSSHNQPLELIVAELIRRAKK